MNRKYFLYGNIVFKYIDLLEPYQYSYEHSRLRLVPGIRFNIGGSAFVFST